MDKVKSQKKPDKVKTEIKKTKNTEIVNTVEQTIIPSFKVD